MCVSVCVCVNVVGMNFRCDIFQHYKFHINSLHIKPAYNV